MKNKNDRNPEKQSRKHNTCLSKPTVRYCFSLHLVTKRFGSLSYVANDLFCALIVIILYYLRFLCANLLSEDALLCVNYITCVFTEIL